MTELSNVKPDRTVTWSSLTAVKCDRSVKYLSIFILLRVDSASLKIGKAGSFKLMIPARNVYFF